MSNRCFALLCLACALLGAGATHLRFAAAQPEIFVPIRSPSYARLHVTGEDALLFTEERIIRFAGPKVRQDMAVENATGVRAVVPMQLIHLNSASRMGWDLIGPVDVDADEFLLRKRD